MKLSLPIVLLVAAVTSALAQEPKPRIPGAILARVVDDAGAPISGVEIRFPVLNIGFPVPDGGKLLLKDMKRGTYIVQARRVGYAAQNRVAYVGDDTATVEFTLSRVTTLDTVSVEAAPTGWISDFERYQKLGLGQFFTPKDLRESGALTVSQFMRRARGVMIAYAKRGGTDVVYSPRCGAMTVYLDGSPITVKGGVGEITFASRGSEATVVPPSNPEFDINLVPFAALVAIEVYTDIASIPPKYRYGGERCGAIFLWTR